MNFYKHHIGDYDADTSHLSWDEDMAYSRMIRAYYRREKPLPVDERDVCRLVRAVTKPQREAVSTVLNEFFSLSEDGWHQKRCDEELGLANEKAELNRTNGRKGGRPRKEKTEREPKNNPDGFSSKNPDGFISESEKNLSQTPDSRLQTPDVNQNPKAASSVVQLTTPEQTGDDSAFPVETTRAVQIAVRLRQAGIVGANASNPNVDGWGRNPRVTDDMLDAAVQVAKSRGAARPPGVNYLAPIIEDLLNPPAPKPKRDDWHRTDAGIDRKGRELGMFARGGESYEAYCDRIWAEVRKREGAAA